ncbi:MAG: phenylalanine 4-monooxygenase [Gammaproteobacteria bacterium]|nr:phenylalanine 4-monooxygenase [Gammaproteobacteria bacterium]NNJ79534.1 phenylalanine 4-monooxygenase [Xanthomonadales bacterium]
MKTSTYTSKQPDENGYIPYSVEENAIWRDLMERQIPMLNGRSCRPWIDALDEMNFPKNRVPQLQEVSEVLQKHTGWSVAPVPALIGFTEFFGLLASRRFPVATFIRRREDFDYLQEPDIFHEVFGHTPPLTDSRYAAFVEAYGKAGLAADPKDHSMLARLFWFTGEFGLVNTDEGIRAYGAGIMSSPGELTYATESDQPQRKPFDPIEALRTPYRIDIMQPIYYVIDSFDDLFELAQADLLGHIRQARKLGMHPPLFESA